MKRSICWMLLLGSALSPRAQELGLLPDPASIPDVSRIEPVPEPTIEFGEGIVDDAMTLPEEINITSSAISGNAETGVRFEGPVKLVTSDGTEVFADEAVMDLTSKEIILTGHVSLYQGNLLQRGDRAVYNYETKVLQSTAMRASVNPLLLEAGKFTMEEVNGQRIFVGEDAGVTTHDGEQPNYWLRADRTRVYPGEKVVFNNLKVYAGDTPVFWLPYLSQPLSGELGYHFVPGASSRWGPFWLNTYGIMLGGKRNEVGDQEDAWLLSQWHVDLYGRRGIGTGVDLSDIRLKANPNLTGLSIYYINDLHPSLERDGISRGFVNEDRYRIDLAHRWDLEMPVAGEWRADANLSLLSDEFYLADFQPSVFRTDPAPDNTLGLYRRDDVSLLSIFTRLRVNDFYRADQRLPMVAFDMARRPLFNSPVLHEGLTSFGVIDEKIADGTKKNLIDPLFALAPGDPAAGRFLRQLGGVEREIAERMLALPLGDPRRDELRQQLLNPSFWRFHTYQEFSLPLKLGEFVTLTPQAGLGYSHYGSVEGPVADFGRTHLHAGVEASTKITKRWDQYHHRSLGINQLLHVLQPYAAWSVLATDSVDSEFLGVDRLTPTTRPRPLEPTRYTAIDGMRSWNTLRLGARNRLLTRRDGQSHEWLYLNTYMDAFLKDGEGDRSVSNLYNDLQWSPLPWVRLEVETQLPLFDGGSGFRELNARTRFMPNENTEFAIGYRILDGHPQLLDSNQIDLQFYRRLNENWGVGSRHRFEMDDGVLEFQQYTLHRDLGNWVAGLGISHRDNRLREEFGVIFSLSLKDFQSAALPFELRAR